MKLHVALNGKAQVANDTLYELYDALERNRGECELPKSTLMRQTLDTAQRFLRDSHIFLATMQDGTELFFTGRMPPGVSVEAALKTAGY